MHDFIGPTGANSLSSLTLSGNTLLGMCEDGGANDSGCIYSIQTDGGQYKDLYDFNHTGYRAQNNSLIVSGENLYGMLPYGGTSDYGVVFVYKDITLSVNNIKANIGGINAYPNPSNSVFTLQAKSEELRGNNIEIFNVLGKQVCNSQITTLSSQFTIDLSSQPSGIYLYRVITNNGDLIGEGKLMIEK
jgi:hypothetical protein